MPLFTDGIASAIEDLRAQETHIFDLASAEGVDLTAKLQLAQQEVGIELTRIVQRIGSANGELDGVVVTPPLKLWHVFHTLSIVYRDAYFNQLNDRYQSKWKEYRALAGWAQDMLVQTGLGVVAAPIGKAGLPVLGSATGAGVPNMYFAQYAWTNAAGQEGMPGDAKGLATNSGYVLTVLHGNPPRTSAGWNVYVGTSIDSLTRQNAEPLPLSVPWTMPPEGLVQGPQPGTGQQPDVLRPVPRVQLRG
jgi:hypothetical protein